MLRAALPYNFYCPYVQLSAKDATWKLNRYSYIFVTIDRPDICMFVCIVQYVYNVYMSLTL